MSMISVILPTYNRAYCLEASMNSVLNQSYPDLELIIVDDGSDDGTKELVENMQQTDPRVRYFYTQINQGAAAARNYGIERASGDYLAFQDSDDLWRPEKLSLQMKQMDEKKADFCYHEVQCNFGNGQYAILPQQQVPVHKKEGDIYEQMLYENLVDCPSLLVKRGCIDRIGMFDTQMKALEDYDLALLLAREYRAAFVNQVLLDSGYTPGSVSLQAVNYLNASCYLVAKYKADYLATNTLNHRLERILEDSKRIGLQEQYIALLEKIMTL